MGRLRRLEHLHRLAHLLNDLHVKRAVLQIYPALDAGGGSDLAD
jgi:hypothetical protein